MGGYVPPEGNRKKREQEAEMVGIVIEAASFSSAVPGAGLEKITQSAEIISTGASSAIGAKIEIVKKTEEYGRIYKIVLDKTDEAVKKSSSREEKKQREKHD